MSIQPNMDKSFSLSSSIRIERSNPDKEITNKISAIRSVRLNGITVVEEGLIQGNIKSTDAKVGKTHANRTEGSTQPVRTSINNGTSSRSNIFIGENTNDITIGGTYFHNGPSTSRGGKSSEASNTGCGGSTVFIGKNKGKMVLGGHHFYNVSSNSMNNMRPGTTASNDFFSKNFAKHNELNIVSINVASTDQSQPNQASSKK